MKHIATLLLFILFNYTYAQNTDTAIYTIADVMPGFKGGDSALFGFLKANVMYPSSCADSGIQGKVYVRFIVEKDGHVSNPGVVKGIHPNLNKESLRVVGLLPPYTNGSIKGQPVRVAMVIPISFKIKAKQEAQPKKTDDSTAVDHFLKTLSKVEKEPVFPGGASTLAKYLDINIHYPLLCRQLNIQGSCTIGFTVDTTGSIVNIHVLNSRNFDLDNEAMRVVKLLPDFIPAINNGQKVNCDLSLSLNFTLACSSDDFYMSSEDDYRLRYPGGFSELFNTIFDKLTIEDAPSAYISGDKFIVTFKVDTNGKASVTKIEPDNVPSFNKAMKETIENLEYFRPGKVNDQKLASTITFPVKIKKKSTVDGKMQLQYDKYFYFGKSSSVNEEYSYFDDLPSVQGKKFSDIQSVLAGKINIPQEEYKYRYKGKTYIRVFIEDEGTPINARVYKGVTDGLDKEALRAIQDLRNVSPARRDGKNIGMEMLIPVDFSNF